MRTGVNLVKYGVYALVLLVIPACGGGGGSSPSPAVGSGGSLTVQPASLVFNARVGVALPPPQTIMASFTEPQVANLLIGFPPGTTPLSWLQLGAVGHASPVQITVTVTSVSMPAGTYTVTVRVVTVAADQSVISLRDVPVTYILTP